MKKNALIANLLIAFLLLSPVITFAQKKTKKVKLDLEETTFHIRNVANGKYLDLQGYASKAQSHSGANVQLWDLDEGNDRKLKFIPSGNGYYYIQFQHAKVNLDVHGCYDGKLFCGTYKKEKGANVQIWKAGSSKPQQWKLEQIKPGKFRIINRYSGKSLDASAKGLNKNGGNVLQWTWHGNDNQLWELIDVKTGAKYQE